MDGWTTTFLLGFGLFSGALAVKRKQHTKDQKKKSWYLKKQSVLNNYLQGGAPLPVINGGYKQIGLINGYLS